MLDVIDTDDSFFFTIITIGSSGQKVNVIVIFLRGGPSI